MRIALDAMGGDRAPLATVRGALLAAPQLQARIALVGDVARLREVAGGQGERLEQAGLELVEAPQSLAMDEHPVEAVRRKPRSSLVVAARLVGQGEADALVSAGNTGAVVAASVLHIGRLPGVERAAIAVVLPLPSGPVVLVDAGANVDCRPQHLLQFGVLGAAFARGVLGVEPVRVGLLNVGEEPIKGNEAAVQAHRLMRERLAGFVGNVEGRDLFTGACDVAVCDGFVGNVLLKALEGFSQALLDALRRTAMGSLRGRIGGLLLRPALRALRERLDYRTYGGSFLLGLRRLVVVAHGRSDAVAIASALKTAARGVRDGVVQAMEAAVGQLTEKGAG